MESQPPGNGLLVNNDIQILSVQCSPKQICPDLYDLDSFSVSSFYSIQKLYW